MKSIYWFNGFVSAGFIAGLIVMGRGLWYHDNFILIGLGIVLISVLFWLLTMFEPVEGIMNR